MDSIVKFWTFKGLTLSTVHLARLGGSFRVISHGFRCRFGVAVLAGLSHTFLDGSSHTVLRQVRAGDGVFPSRRCPSDNDWGTICGVQLWGDNF